MHHGEDREADHGECMHPCGRERLAPTLRVEDRVAHSVVDDPENPAHVRQAPSVLVACHFLHVDLAEVNHAGMRKAAVQVRLLPQEVVLQNPMLCRPPPCVEDGSRNRKHTQPCAGEAEEVDNPPVCRHRSRAVILLIELPQRDRPHPVLAVLHHQASVGHGHQGKRGPRRAAVRSQDLIHNCGAERVSRRGVELVNVLGEAGHIPVVELHVEVLLAHAEQGQAVRVGGLLRLGVQLLALVVCDGWHRVL
mmetsp:Transcript_78291/g.217402  ORF Transcript_78291/g.217402 Transcript_78291/m.217402 type:complete len:250 (-) Transcript_78291:14-763(-)